MIISKTEISIISERMGESVHNAWIEKRKKERGWHSPEECKNITVQIVESWNCECDLQPALHKSNGAIWCSNCGVNISVKPEYYCKDCHPCMRPYNELPDTDKELDRQYPKFFFEILDDLGYEVLKKGGH